MSNAFQVTDGKNSYDYRNPGKIDLSQVASHIPSFTFKDLRMSNRFAIGIINNGHEDLFFKLATTKGTSLILENEYKWNEEFNKDNILEQFSVPANVDKGYFGELFWMATTRITGVPFANTNDFAIIDSFERLIPSVIDFSEYIMEKVISKVGKPDAVTGNTPQEFFINKAKSWYEEVPDEIKISHKLTELIEHVEKNAIHLETKARHGDFTPWHLIEMPENRVGLIDGEHAMSKGVEYHDVGYLIQRVHTISNRSDLAISIVKELKERKYDMGKLKIILAARAIGGYLDAQLAHRENLELEDNFVAFLKSI